jgi:predicted secreted hydrolase
MKSSLLLATLLAAWRLAVPGYQYEFPRDHFSHPDFQTEWWYYTGNLVSPEGRHFGFELTFFREGVTQEPQPRPWGVNDVYLAHLAVSDLDGARFYHTERLNRAGPGFAGADLASGRIWNGNWQSTWRLADLPNGVFTDQELEAVADAFSFDLHVLSRKPPVIHGVNGVSQKAQGVGRASHYISFTRLETTGSITLNRTRFKVTGTSWMDHEFFTHQLEADQTGWDWFSIQLDNGADLMLFRIRRRDGAADPYSSGTYVEPNGTAHHLSRGDFTLIPAPTAGSRYPLAWTIEVPPLHLTLHATTPLPTQEFTAESASSPSYWEGAIRLSGTQTGVGYLEMTGYEKAVRF